MAAPVDEALKVSRHSLGLDGYAAVALVVGQSGNAQADRFLTDGLAEVDPLDEAFDPNGHSLPVAHLNYSALFRCDGNSLLKSPVVHRMRIHAVHPAIKVGNETLGTRDILRTVNFDPRPMVFAGLHERSLSSGRFVIQRQVDHQLA